MQILTRQDLMPLETYAVERKAFRDQVINHKRHRRISLGPNLNLYFEDRMTMLYQVQEMLRVERIFEAQGIEEELDAYNPLIPDGSNLKATMMLEYGNVNERRSALTQLVGIEDKIWVQVQGHDKVYAIADEDLERSEDDKTSSVHFLRFELGEGAADAKTGAAISMGVEHSAYQFAVEPISSDQQDALIKDFD